MGRSAVLLVAILVSSTALADAPPRILLRGSLSDTAGQPVNGMRELTLSLYTAASGGSPFFSEQQTVMVTGGELTVALGGAGVLDLARFLEEDNVYLGIAVGDEAEMSPRVQMHSVPYAAMAQHVSWSSIADIPPSVENGVDPAVFQRRLASSCGEGQALAGIDAEGSPTCVPLAATLSGACAPGSVVTGIAGGELQCAPDGGPQLTVAGGGLVVDGTTIRVVYGQVGATVTEGDDPRLLPNPDEDGWLGYTWDDEWVALLPGAQGEMLHSRPPEEGPPYWGPLLAEEVPPLVPHYIWNYRPTGMVPPPQDAGFFINGPGVIHGHFFAEEVQTNVLTIGGGTSAQSINYLAFKELEMGVNNNEFNDCGVQDVEVCINVPDPVNEEVCAEVPVPLIACINETEFVLDFVEDPMIFTSIKYAGTGDATFAATWNLEQDSENRYQMHVVRIDEPGEGWGSDVSVHMMIVGVPPPPEENP